MACIIRCWALSNNVLVNIMMRVLFFVSEFCIGGTMSSLYSLLSVLDPDKIQVDIFSRLHSGPYYKRIPNCTILKENIWLSHTIYERSIFAKIATKLLLVIRKALEPVGIDMYALFHRIGGKQIHSDEYDALIGYDESMARLISYFPAKKRINWIHSDYRRFSQGRDETKYYDKIDAVVCVSNYVKGVFSEVYPQYADKVYAIHNVINVEDIRKKAQEPIDDSRFKTDDYTIVSCGRLDPVKQFSLIPGLAAQLKAKGSKLFKWYIIGGGNDTEQQAIEAEIEKHKVQDIVVILGMKKNVYPYIAKSDLYVCTSSSESYPMVVNEAKALLIPVISNNFPSAAESIRNGVDGVICAKEEMVDNIITQMNHPLSISADSYQNETPSIIKDFEVLLDGQ